MFVVTQKNQLKNNLVHLGFIWQACCISIFLALSMCVPAEDCIPEGCEGEGGTCADLSGYQTDCYWVNMFNACCEDTERQVLNWILFQFTFLCLFPHLFEDKRNSVGSPRHLSDSYLSSCLLNSLSLLPIWTQLSAQERNTYQCYGIDTVERRQ